MLKAVVHWRILLSFVICMCRILGPPGNFQKSNPDPSGQFFWANPRGFPGGRYPVGIDWDITFSFRWDRSSNFKLHQSYVDYWILKCFKVMLQIKLNRPDWRVMRVLFIVRRAAINLWAILSLDQTFILLDEVSQYSLLTYLGGIGRNSLFLNFKLFSIFLSFYDNNIL